MGVILIRHTFVDTPPGICYGQTDVSLEPTFGQEAAIIQENPKSYLLSDYVYTDPLTRYVRFASYCGYPDVGWDEWIMEINFEGWEMKPFDLNNGPHLQE